MSMTKSVLKHHCNTVKKNPTLLKEESKNLSWKLSYFYNLMNNGYEEYVAKIGDQFLFTYLNNYFEK